MSRYIDADALKYYGNHIGDEYEDRYHDAQWVYRSQIDTAPSIEPNLILPEQMGRGDIYEVGETIVVMNHDDYYDLLCKSWMPKRGEWKPFDLTWGRSIWYCTACEESTEVPCDIWEHKPIYKYCPNCGADMRKESK